jgi:hypothetical protein
MHAIPIIEIYGLAGQTKQPDIVNFACIDCWEPLHERLIHFMPSPESHAK